VKNGNISFSDEHGNTKISAGANWRPPEWVPVYPGAAFASGANADSDEQEGGGGGLSTSDSVEQVASFYESELKRLGMQANKTTMGVVATVTGQDEAGGRTVNVVIGNDGSKTTIQLSFSKKK
jgi:hypothetical protein